MDKDKEQNKIVSLARHSFRTLASMLSRADLASALGQQFGGARDLYSVLGYKKILNCADYLARYRRDDLASRIIDAPVESTWAGRIKIEDEFSSNQDSGFEKDLNKLIMRLKLFSYMERVDKLAGLGRYAVLLIGTSGSSNLALPVERLRSPGDVLYIAPFSEDAAQIKSFVENSGDPDYGKPLLYQISTGSSSNGVLQGTRSVTVHKSRVIHVADGLLEDEVFGRPRLEKVFNRLDDLAKVVGGSAETFWLAANRGIQVEVDPETELDPADAVKLEQQIEAYQHQLRRFIQTRGVELKSLGADSVNPEGVFKTLISIISGATGIPQRILLGSEMGQLASSQDRANWAARVSARQRSFAEAIILRPFIDRLIEFGALPAPKDDHYEIDWPDALVLNENEKAQRASTVASASNSLNSEVVTVGEFRERFLGLPSNLPEGE